MKFLHGCAADRDPRYCGRNIFDICARNSRRLRMRYGFLHGSRQANTKRHVSRRRYCVLNIDFILIGGVGAQTRIVCSLENIPMVE